MSTKCLHFFDKDGVDGEFCTEYILRKKTLVLWLTWNGVWKTADFFTLLGSRHAKSMVLSLSFGNQSLDFSLVTR